MNDDAIISIAKIPHAASLCNHHFLVFMAKNAPKSYHLTFRGVLMNYRKLEKSLRQHSDLYAASCGEQALGHALHVSSSHVLDHLAVVAVKVGIII